MTGGVIRVYYEIAGSKEELKKPCKLFPRYYTGIVRIGYTGLQLYPVVRSSQGIRYAFRNVRRSGAGFRWELLLGFRYVQVCVGRDTQLGIGNFTGNDCITPFNALELDRRNAKED